MWSQGGPKLGQKGQKQHLLGPGGPGCPKMAGTRWNKIGTVYRQSKLTILTTLHHSTVRPTTGLFRTVEPNSPRTVYGLPLYRFDLCYIVYMVRNTIFHHAKVLPLGFLGAYGLPDAP